MSVSLQETKAKAERMRMRAQSLGLQVTSAQAYELLACAFGDPSWGAMKARLQRQSPAKAPEQSAPGVLQFFEVSVYAQIEDGSRSFLARRIVVCRSNEQARQFMFREFFEGTVYDHAEASAVFETDVGATLAVENMPALDGLCEWLELVLKGGARRANDAPCSPSSLEAAFSGTVRAKAFWDRARTHGAVPAQPEPSTPVLALRQMLVQAASDFFGPSELLESLYAALGDGLLYNEEEEDAFGYEEEELRWKSALR